MTCVINVCTCESWYGNVCNQCVPVRGGRQNDVCNQCVQAGFDSANGCGCIRVYSVHGHNTAGLMQSLKVLG